MIGQFFFKKIKTKFRKILQVTFYIYCALPILQYTYLHLQSDPPHPHKPTSPPPYTPTSHSICPNYNKIVLEKKFHLPTEHKKLSMKHTYFLENIFHKYILLCIEYTLMVCLVWRKMFLKKKVFWKINSFLTYFVMFGVRKKYCPKNIWL